MDNLIAHLERATWLISDLKLHHKQILQIGIDWRGLRFQLSIEELIRVSRRVSVARSEVKIEPAPGVTHVEFVARGATWQGCLLDSQKADFMKALGIREVAIENKPALLTER